jgi:hypothetical protein
MYQEIQDEVKVKLKKDGVFLGYSIQMLEKIEQKVQQEAS